MKKVRFFILISLSIFFFTIVSFSAKAYVLNQAYWPKPNSLTYFVSSTVVNQNYQGYADHGAIAWNSSSKIQVSKSATATLDGTKTQIVMSDVDLGDVVATGKTYKSDGSQCIAGWNCQAYSGKITIHKPGFQGLTSAQKYETMTHEMGHILGLAHEDYLTSIMLSKGWINKSIPQTDDWNGINVIYP